MGRGSLLSGWNFSAKLRQFPPVGREPHAGAAGWESWGRADCSGCRRYSSTDWSRQPFCATEFISSPDCCLSSLLTACVILKVRSFLVDLVGQLELPSETLFAARAKPHSQSRWLLPVWHFVISSIAVNPGRLKSCSWAAGKLREQAEQRYHSLSAI